MDNKMPGRLGNPNETLMTDVRADPRIIDFLKMSGLDKTLQTESGQLTEDSNYEELLAYCANFEEGSTAAHPMEWEMMPEYPNVLSSEETIQGTDGNNITLFVHKPKIQTDKVPCVVHTHGGDGSHDCRRPRLRSLEKHAVLSWYGRRRH